MGCLLWIFVIYGFFHHPFIGLFLLLLLLIFSKESKPKPTTNPEELLSKAKQGETIYYTVNSPFDGVVENVYVYQGSTIQSNEAIVRIKKAMENVGEDITIAVTSKVIEILVYPGQQIKEDQPLLKLVTIQNK